jgi:hypothetical protein
MPANQPRAEPRPDIPWFRCGPDYPMATLEAFEDFADRLIAGATRHIPAPALRAADAVSRRWLVRAGSTHLDEIDQIAERLARHGAYFLSVNYEWGCTVALRERAGRPELVRVLDWRTPGLGRYVIAADVNGPAGRFVTLTWPGYTGVLQATAPGRFAAAINQAPMPKTGGGIRPVDWVSNKVALWRRPGRTPAHLLRDVFETAPDYATALEALAGTPIASPVIYSLAGCAPGEIAVIERTSDHSRVRQGPRAVANTWISAECSGHPRGKDNPGRMAQFERLKPSAIEDFAWLTPPVLNPRTRLAACFTPADGRLVAQGFEAMQPATALLHRQPAESSNAPATASDGPRQISPP